MSWQATRWARDQITGSAGAKGVLMILAEHVGDEAVCFLSAATIAERAELKRTATLQHLAALEARRLISRTRRPDQFGHRTSDTIRLLITEIQSPEAEPRNQAKVQDADLGDIPRSVKQGAKVRETGLLGPESEPYLVSEKVLSRERAAPSRAKPSTSIPEGFPDRGAIDREKLFLKAKGWNIDADLEAESFRGHALNQGRTGKDWPAAFHNWIIKAIGYAKPSARIAQVVDVQAGPVVAPWRDRVKAFAGPANHYWNSTDWGPAPGRAGCKVPVEIAAEFIPHPDGKIVPIGRAAVA